MPLPLLEGVAWAGSAHRCGGVQVVSSLSACILVSPSTLEVQAGFYLPPDTARAEHFQCELRLCPSLA